MPAFCVVFFLPYMFATKIDTQKLCFFRVLLKEKIEIHLYASKYIQTLDTKQSINFHSQ